MHLPTLDFETYSEAGYQFDPASGRFLPVQKNKPGINAVGAAVYAEHPSTRLISLCADLLDGVGVRLWKAGDPIPEAIINCIKSGALVEAHNSMFEYLIWSHVCYERLGWCPTELAQWRDSSAKAAAFGMPGKLAVLSDLFDVTDKKRTAGKKLIQQLCVPKAPTAKDPALFRAPELYPELFYKMYDYNHYDVVSEHQVSEKLPELTAMELQVWLADQRINDRGVYIDTESLDACINIFEQSQINYVQELQAVTHGAVNSIEELAKLKGGDLWAQSRGVTLKSFNKDTIAAALKGDGLPPDVRRVLEIKEAAGGAAVKKIYAMQRGLTRGNRVKGTLQYCGARRTGRWAGRILQTQNMKSGGPDWTACPSCGSTFACAGPMACPSCGCALHNPEINEWSNESTEAALADIRTGDLHMVIRRWGDVVKLIGSCIRGLIMAAPGHDLICSDYSAIEAVVLAVLAGEQWRIDVFNSHGKIYEMSAAMITGIPFEEIMNRKKETGKHHPLRKKIGKVSELASGYAGWIGAWKAFGADKFMTDDEIKQNILKWREKSPAIVEMWGGQFRKHPDRWEFTPELFGVEGCFVSAVLTPGVTYRHRLISFTFDQERDVLLVGLPSGRDLAYHSPRLHRETDRFGREAFKITIMGVHPKTGQWVELDTYGGRLVENITQAVARDILAAAIVRLESYGYPIVMHIHDEAAAEVPHGVGSVEHFEAVMEVREPWFHDWPLRASGGWRGKRFRK